MPDGQQPTNPTQATGTLPPSSIVQPPTAGGAPIAKSEPTKPAISISPETAAKLNNENAAQVASDQRLAGLASPPAAVAVTSQVDPAAGPDGSPVIVSDYSGRVFGTYANSEIAKQAIELSCARRGGGVWVNETQWRCNFQNIFNGDSLLIRKLTISDKPEQF